MGWKWCRRTAGYELRIAGSFQFECFLVGSLLRLAEAIRSSSALDMDSTIWREALFREDLDRSPRLADNAAPAAICCFLDLAGIIDRDGVYSGSGAPCRSDGCSSL